MELCSLHLVLSCRETGLGGGWGAGTSLSLPPDSAPQGSTGFPGGSGQGAGVLGRVHVTKVSCNGH